MRYQDGAGGSLVVRELAANILNIASAWTDEHKYRYLLHNGASDGKGCFRIRGTKPIGLVSLRNAFSEVARWLRHWPRRKILIWGSASLALLLLAVTGGGYVILKHFNANLQQDDIRGLLGAQPVNMHPQAENIMVIGSDSRQGLSKAYGSGLVTDQSDTLMIIHIPANREWAEVMSIPRDSWVNIPACKMGNGQMSAPQQFKINEAFAIGNLDGNRTALGIACTVKTLKQVTGIYIDHFVAVNFTGFKDMVAALGGVYECNPTPINDRTRT